MRLQEMKGRQSFPNQSLLLVFVLWGGWLHCATIADHHGLGCRSLRFVKPVEGFALQGHVIESIPLDMGIDEIGFECRILCGMESTCVSINIGPAADDGVSLCQLSNSDHIRHPGDLKPQEGFLYWATKNPCFSNPCLHNATCLNGFTDKRYICLCQAGYTGENCEAGESNFNWTFKSVSLLLATGLAWLSSLDAYLIRKAAVLLGLLTTSSVVILIKNTVVSREIIKNMNSFFFLFVFGSAEEELRSVIICENHKANVNCPSGKIIDVLDANYGRLDRRTCIHVSMSDINCVSSNSLGIVQNKCSCKTSCELLANNREFGGDPCAGTYKYLEVKYRCLKSTN
ncbi:uncharacterized protein LOC144641025 [Oculina patagonica]